LTYPNRTKGFLAPFDFTKNHTIEMFPPDTKKFPCLALAYEALKTGGTMSCYMNAANEILVNRFLNKEIRWCDIPRKLEKLMEQHDAISNATLETIIAVDENARKEAASA